MGVVLDFIGFVLGRPDRPGPRGGKRRAGVPLATFGEAAFRAALARLDGTKVSEVKALGPELAASCLSYGDERRKVANVAMQAFPDAAWVLSLDRDGYIRAAALQRLASPATSAARFIVIALRLNDWVPEVRAEAVRAAGRVWPITPAEVAADAALYLLRQRYSWGRWGDEALCIDELLARPDVAAAVGARFLHARSGALGRSLSQVLRFDGYDAGLADLAVRACLPDVRAVALKTLLAGRALWPVGYDWVWVDKSMGERRRVMRTESRLVSVAAPTNLMEVGLTDRSVLVRKVAADHAVAHMADLPDIAEIAARLAADRSATVRERGDFILRRLGGVMGRLGLGA